MSSSSTLSLRHHVKQTLIIAHNEDTGTLVNTLQGQGFQPQIVRQEHQPHYETYSRNYLAFMNHHQAWQRVQAVDGLTMVVEADFVPVRGMGDLPLPMASDCSDFGMAWLYTCAAQLYSVSGAGYAEGFSTSMVAYLMGPKGAIALDDLMARITQCPGPYTYSTWDSEIADFLLERRLKTFIPLRNYGEHGGYPNPEHQRYGLSWTHRADVLHGPLAFMPLYALQAQKPQSNTFHSSTASDSASPQSSQTAPSHSAPVLSQLSDRHPLRCWWAYQTTRAMARLKGVGRLLLGKFLRAKVINGSSVPFNLLWFAIRRQWSRTL